MDNPGNALIFGGMKQICDVIIIGGGLNGCAMALALVSGGLKVTMIDRISSTDQALEGFDGRSYALALASTRVLSAIGLWDELSPNAQPINEIKVTDGRAGEGASPFWMHFDHAELGEGPVGHMVEDRHLRKTFLTHAAESPDLNQIAPGEVIAQNVTGNQVTVTLDDGTKHTASLVIGCDGRKSRTAERAGISRSFKDYGQTALVAAIGHKKSHEGIAHQFFLPAGPLAILPLTGKRSSIVWAETHAQAADISKLPDEEFIAELRPAFGDFLGELHVAGARFIYPLNQTIAEALIADRTALVGDAAHGIHPIAGQGLNQGLRDVAALAETLVDAKRRGEDLGASDVLQRYAAWRSFDRTMLANATDGFNALFSNDNTTLRMVRDVGMGILNAIPPARRAIMREAAGVTGDLPRLMRGQSL